MARSMNHNNMINSNIITLPLRWVFFRPRPKTPGKNPAGRKQTGENQQTKRKNTKGKNQAGRKNRGKPANQRKTGDMHTLCHILRLPLLQKVHHRRKEWHRAPVLALLKRGDVDHPVGEVEVAPPEHADLCPKPRKLTRSGGKQ